MVIALSTRMDLNSFWIIYLALCIDISFLPKNFTSFSLYIVLGVVAILSILCLSFFLITRAMLSALFRFRSSLIALSRGKE
jgi:hypothetical protein